MRRKLLLVLVACLAAWTGFAQGEKADTVKVKKELVRCLDFGVGYVPKKDIEAFRASVAWNNLFFNRFGVFTSIETNKGNDYFSHQLGVTGSITSFAYLYAGLDLFSEVGFFKNGFDSRKIFGVGVYPVDWAVVKLGYTFSVGPTFEVGLRLPLEK